MSSNKDPQIDERNTEENGQSANAIETSTVEEVHHETPPLNNGRTIPTQSGFTGASATASQMLYTSDQVLLRSAKMEAKRRGDASRILFQDPAQTPLNTTNGLLGPTFRPGYGQNHSTGNNPVHASASPGYYSSAPWSSDLAKIKIPKLRMIDPEDIVAFQISYKRYLREVRELEERYYTRIPVRAVYYCILPETLHYLCYMSDLIPVRYRTHPDQIDRGVIHSVIMDYLPKGKGSAVVATQLYDELKKIKIVLWPNGSKSIQKAWYELFKAERKFPTIKLDAKKTIKILVKNIEPKETGLTLMQSMETGDEASQLMRNNLMNFHNRLVQIAEAIDMVKSYGIIQSKSQLSEATSFVGTSGNGKKGQSSTSTKKEKSAAAIRENGCKHHGPNCTHGTSECWIEHPSLAPKNWKRGKAIEKNNAWKKRRQKRANASANVVSSDKDVIIDPSEQKVSIAPEPTAQLATTLNEQINPTGTGSSIDPYQFTCFSMSTPTYDAGDNFTWTCNCNKTQTKIHHSNSQCSTQELVNSKNENASFEDAFTWTHDKSVRHINESSMQLLNDNVIPLPNPSSIWSSSAQKMKIPSKSKGKHSIFTYDVNNDVNYLNMVKSKRGKSRLISWKAASAMPTGAKTTDINSLIWDSGASHSVTSNQTLLKHPSNAPFTTIKGLSGRTPVTAIGTLNKVEGVLAVPNTTQDLLSVGAFLDQKGGKLIFTANQVLYKPEHPITRRPIILGRRREDGLYTALTAALKVPSPSIHLSRAEMQFQQMRERVHTLHRMLGHVGKSKMKAVLASNPQMGLQPHHVDLLTYCAACNIGNAKFSVKPAKSVNKAKIFGERLMSDNSGKVRIQSRSGCNYACVIVDEYSSWVWLRGLHSLSQTKEFVAHVIQVKLHQRNDRCVKIFRSDNGTEYINQDMNDLLSQHGIVRERTCPSSSYQNGKAERYIGILFSMMRKALFESRMPASFWLEALHWAVYTHNRLPLTSRKDQRSPFELRYGRQPDLGNLRPFGVRGTITMLRSSRNGKQQPTGEPCILLGYGYVTGQKGYRVYKPHSKTVSTSTSVSFDSMYNSILHRRSTQPELYVDDQQRLVQCSMLDNSLSASSGPSPLFHNSVIAEATTVGGISSRPRSSQNLNQNLQNSGSTTNVPFSSSSSTTNVPFSSSSTVAVPPTTPPRSQISEIQRKIDVDEKTAAFRLTEFENNQDELPERIIKRISKITEDQNRINASSANGNSTSTTQITSEEADLSIVDESEPTSPKKLKKYKGYEYAPVDHPYFNRDKDGRPIESPDRASGNSIAERMKSRNRNKATGLTLVSDCHPNYMEAVAHVASDLASNHKTPKHYGEIRKSPDKVKWLEAIKLELDSLMKMGCYVEVNVSDLPPNTNILSCTWVFKVKKNGDGTVERFKARICVRGDQQIYGIDFVEVFSPVANQTTIRLILALAVHYDLELLQFDIKLAFVTSKVDRPVFMKIPPGAKQSPGKVWKLKKSLYGLKQAPRLFNEHLNQVLKEQGFMRSEKDACLYFYKTKHIFTVLVIVVDDILLATNNKNHAKQFELTMQRKFDFKSMGSPKYMIGMNLTRGPTYLTISQQEYLREISQRFQIERDPPTKLPAASIMKLTTKGFAGKPDSPSVNIKKYRSIVGALNYAVLTRPDVATSVSMAARFLHCPTEDHMKFARKILRYLHDTKEMKLTYQKTQNPDLVVYADSSHGDDTETRRSRYGYMIFLGNALICWKSKLGSGVKLSTAEAEYVCATQACKEIMWVKHLLKELDKCQKYPVIINEDNQACISMSKNPVVSGRNKHMEIKMHYVRECVKKNEVSLRYIGTRDQLADILTKNLPSPIFVPIREKIMNPGAHKPMGMC